MTDTNTPDRVMVDIETLGIEPGAAILSIGAVRFNDDGLGEEFYAEINLPSCQQAGLEIDATTLEWWLGQDDVVREVLTGGDDLGRVLRRFRVWLSNPDELWANSPKFDMAHLEAAFEAVDASPPPWDYDDLRDVRTVTNLPADVDVEQQGDEHDALDDARYQARQVIALLGALSSDE